MSAWLQTLVGVCLPLGLLFLGWLVQMVYSLRGRVLVLTTQVEDLRCSQTELDDVVRKVQALKQELVGLDERNGLKGLVRAHAEQLAGLPEEFRDTRHGCNSAATSAILDARLEILRLCDKLDGRLLVLERVAR